MSEYEKYSESYFSRPSNQRDCLMEIVGKAWGFGEELGEYGLDYVQGMIDFEESEQDRELDMSLVYLGTSDNISRDLGDFRSRCRHFLRAFYQQRDCVIALTDNDNVLNDVFKVISIIEKCLERLEDTLLNYEAGLCYAMYWNNLEGLERERGKNAVKHFKKYDELTLKEYKSAFKKITDFMGYVSKNEFGSRLMELGAKLRIFCELHIDKSENGEDRNRDDLQAVTLIDFMQKHCERQTLNLLKCRRKSLNDANHRKAIYLPKPIREWKTGQAKYYSVVDLKEKWPTFCDVLPNLPPLKQS
jgi:hypothetical protein